MGLFTNPQVINDGTARSFELLGTTGDQSLMSADYIETAAASSANSRITVRQDRRSKTSSHANIRVTENAVTTAGVSKPIVANFTVHFDPGHAQADVEKIIKRLAAATSLPNTPTGLILGRP